MWAKSGLVGTTLLLIVMTPFTPGAASGAPGQQPATAQDRPTFSVQVDLVTTDLVARDGKGNFVSDLTRDEFEVYEDGVKQDIVSITLSHGGRVSNVLAPPPARRARRHHPAAAAPHERHLGPHFRLLHRRPAPAVSKRTARALAVQENLDLLLHDGDMFGIVSSGTSSISIQLTYDKKRIDEVIEKISGDELKPSEIINGATGTGGPAEVRHRARVAMDTVTELLGNLEKIHDRRKSLVYVSDGYDFIPFQAARLGLMNGNSPFLMNDRQRGPSSRKG